MYCRKTPVYSIAFAFAIGLSCHVHAQSIVTNVFDTVVPFTYDQGKNVSVTDRQRLEYDPLGVQLGSFTLFPRLDVSTAYTDNVYETTTGKISDAFVSIKPSVRLLSDWSVNTLAITATGNFERFAREAARNEDGWSVGANTRLSLDSYKFISLSARTGRYYEDQFVGAPQTGLKSTVSAQSTSAAANGDLQFGDLRTVLAGDYTHLAYNPATTLADTTELTTERNRDVSRAIGHAEYHLTPDVLAFGEIVSTFTGYQTALANGQANRNSTEIRVLAGISLDLATKIRGNIGIGYIDRHYHAPIYADEKGFSLRARIEYFLSGLTSISLVGRRDIEDAVYFGAGGFFNNGVTLRVDHELFRNILLNIGSDIEYDRYRQSNLHDTIWRSSVGADYLANNSLKFTTSVTYGNRSSSSTLIGSSVNEFRTLIGIVYHR